jgi:hypothetical protein
VIAADHLIFHGPIASATPSNPHSLTSPPLENCQRPAFSNRDFAGSFVNYINPTTLTGEVQTTLAPDSRFIVLLGAQARVGRHLSRADLRGPCNTTASTR